MADRFVTITRISATKWTISGKIVDSQTQRVTKADFTGVNNFTVDFNNFVTLASRLTTTQQDELANIIINYFLTAMTPDGA
jgi:hypothetical protein